MDNEDAFFHIFVQLFGYSFITQTSFKPWKTCLCLKSVGPQKATTSVFVPFPLRPKTSVSRWKCCKEAPFSYWFYSLTVAFTVWTLTTARCFIRSYFVKLVFFPGDWRFCDYMTYAGWPLPRRSHPNNGSSFIFSTLSACVLTRVPQLPVKKKKRKRKTVVTLMWSLSTNHSRVSVRNLQPGFFWWHRWDRSPWLRSAEKTTVAFKRVPSLRLSQKCVSSRWHGPSSFCLRFVFLCFQMSVNNFYSWKSCCVVFLRCALT